MTRFTERPSLGKYETLTSYLNRISECNGSDLCTVAKYIIPRKEITLRNLCQLDILPRKIADMDKLSVLVGKSSKCIESHTFTPAIDKLIINDDVDDQVHMSSLLSRTINTKNRRLCPICVKTSGAYSLLWQVQDIIMCDKHLVPLMSECPKCKSIIPYCSEYINQHRCIKCGSTYLVNQHEIVQDKQIINTQMDLYTTWKYLLDPDAVLIMQKQGFNKEQMLALMMLYTAQNYEPVFDIRSIRYISYKNVRNLVKKVNGISDNYQTRLHVILKFLSNSNISIEQFSKKVIPDSYVKSVVEYYRNSIKKSGRKNIGPCLSPWCKSYKKKKSIKQVTGYRLYHQRYKVSSVCTECNIKFGFNRKNGKWESIDNEVDLIWNKVKPLLDKGLTKGEIRNKLAIGEEKIYKIYGYLSYHKLIEDNKSIYYDEYNQDDLIEKFKDLVEQPGDMVGNSYKLYKWTQSKFYYLLANPRVQNFLIFESNDLRKKYASKVKDYDYDYWKGKVDIAIDKFLNENIIITIKKICIESGVSDATLRRYKLNEYISEIKLKQINDNKVTFIKRLFDTVEGYLNELEEDGQPAVLNKAFDKAGTYDKFMRANYPDITKCLAEKVKEYNDGLAMKRSSEELNQIIDAMNEIEFDYQFSTKRAISKATGLSKHIINKRLKLLENKK